MKKKKKTKRFKAEGDAKLLIDLEAITRLKRDDSETARSLLRWFLANKFWTEKQYILIKFLLCKHKADTPVRSSKYNLYAISDGESIKLGVSTDVQKRIKSMQTGHPKQLSVMWKLFVGCNRGDAFKAERKLHRFCKAHRLRGEWFSPECMDIVKGFSL